MASSIFPTTNTTTVTIAALSALSGDGSPGNGLAVTVDGDTISMAGNVLHVDTLDPDSTPEFAGLGIGTPGTSGEINLIDADSNPAFRVVSEAIGSGLLQLGGVDHRLFVTEATGTGVESVWKDEADGDNLVRLQVLPAGETSSDLTQFYLQRSLTQNAIIALQDAADAGNDGPVATFDIYNASDQYFNVAFNPQGSGNAILEFYNGADFFTVLNGTGAFSGSVSASSYTATALPSSDAGLTAGQFYQTAGVVMVKL